MSFINERPHLDIALDKNMDLWTVREFLSFDPEDVFSSAILTLNPSLEEVRNFEDVEREKFFVTYIDWVYKKEDGELKRTQDKLQRDWAKIENTFLSVTGNLFNGHPWPKGAYVGFLSVFNCNPRFLDQKTFQVYYKHPEGLVSVSAHELLHFMFYDYIEAHQDLVKDVTESMIWKLSEIFNVVILGLPEFVAITNNLTPKPYSSHKDLIPEFVGLWESTEQIDEFIREGCCLLNS